MKPAQASNTAKVIAASTILLDSDPRSAAQVAPGAAALCRQLLSGNRADRWLAASAAHPLTRRLWRWVERLTLPGIMAHYWHRKRWIEQRCRAAVAEGFGRIVIMGAGFDTLGLRLAGELHQIEIIEIDHPATQLAKRHALAGCVEAQAAKLRYIPLDLSTAALPALLLNDSKATVFICEGVLMYLPPAGIARLFDTLRMGSGGRMRMLFSFMTKWPDGSAGFRPRSWWIERWLAWRGEPFTWAIAPQAMHDFLASHGFGLMEMALTGQFTEPSNPHASTLEGENLVMCERAAASGH